MSRPAMAARTESGSRMSASKASTKPGAMRFTRAIDSGELFE